MELQTFFSLVGLLAIMWWMVSIKRSLSEQVRQNKEIIEVLKERQNKAPGKR